MCVWTEDADAIKWDDKQLKLVYQNQRIKDYLNSNRKLGIAGTKGQGKTFLIKTKRTQYQSIYKASNDKNIACFPINIMVDTLDSSVNVNTTIRGLLKEYSKWVNLWKISIAVTIMTSDEFKYLFNEKDFDKLKIETKELLNLDNAQRRPSIIFTYLLGLNNEELRNILDDTFILMSFLCKVNSGVYIFIDKVDQAFSVDVYRVNNRDSNVEIPRNASYWQFCQYSLANAAYELVSNINSHIKVFYTIRHEALIDSQRLANNTARNIEAFLVELIYTKDDIEEMFKLYVQNEDDDSLNSPKYKKSNESKAFVGFDRMLHTYVDNVDERVFDYLYRHSLRRPYDIMKICKELYLENPKTLTISRVRHIVNSTSRKVMDLYFAEVEPFITCTYSEVERLLSCINTNIFDINYIQYVCKRYNEEYNMENVCNKDCSNCKNSHPFSTLYNIGILGYLTSSSAHPTKRQRFLPIGESKLKLNEFDLPASDLYILHPCLCDEARKLRSNKNRMFKPTVEVIIGEGIEISDEKIKK